MAGKRAGLSEAQVDAMIERVRSGAARDATGQWTRAGCAIRDRCLAADVSFLFKR